MKHKTVLITGGARGMGRVTAKALAAMGAHVIIADWAGEQAAACLAEIRATGRGSAEYHFCNLASVDSVRALAATIREQHAQLNVLINNAGITYPVRQENESGIEMHFATCHLGHFLLTSLLLDLLKSSAPARIIFVSSEGHKACKGLDFDDLNNVQLWQGRAINHGAAFMAYARAKLANIHTMRELDLRLKSSGVTVNALSPGFFVNTGIHREMRGAFKLGAMLVFGIGALLGLNTAEKGARTHIWLASSDEVEGVSGQYFEHCRPRAMCPHADDSEERARLWAISESLVMNDPAETVSRASAG